MATAVASLSLAFPEVEVTAIRYFNVALSAGASQPS